MEIPAIHQIIAQKKGERRTSGLDSTFFWVISSFPFSKVTAPTEPNLPPFITGDIRAATEKEAEEDGPNSRLDGISKQRSRPETDSPTESIREEDEALTMKPRRSLQGRVAIGRGMGKQGLSGDKGLGATTL